MWWFPRTIPPAGAPIDYEELNEDFLQAVALMEGNLGEHNWSQNAMTLRSQVAPGAVFQVFRHGANVNVDPTLEVGTGVPGAAPANSFLASNNGVWEVVTSLTNSSIDTGNSRLWIISSFQQQQQGMTSLRGLAHAIRVDGQLIPESLTGTWELTNDKDGGALKTSQDTATIAENGGAYCYRVDAVVPVPPGRHTVDIVVRMFFPPGGGIPASATAFYEIFNRELTVIVMDPTDTDVSGTGVSFTPLAEGDTINAASLNTPFAAIRNEINDLDYTAVKHRSLWQEHLPTMIVASGSTAVADGEPAPLHNYSNAYVDYNVTAGWVVVSQGGTDLAVTFASSVDFTDTTIRGILVLVNLRLYNVDNTGAGGVGQAFYSVFAIQYHTTDGTWRAVSRSERYANAETQGGVQRFVERDVALHTFLIASDIAGNQIVDAVRCVVSVANRTGLVGSIQRTQLAGCNITAVAIQGS